MNSQNDTVVSGKLMEEMRKAGVADGYGPVPKHLRKAAGKLLGNESIADIKGGALGRYTAAKRKITKNQAKAKRRRGVPGW